MEGDEILSVQISELCEVTELRWDGAIEIIRVQGPERATMTEWEQLKMHNIHRLSKSDQIRYYNHQTISNQGV